MKTVCNKPAIRFVIYLFKVSISFCVSLFSACIFSIGPLRKANCDAAKRGKIGELVAKGISDLREFTDLFKNVLVKGMSIAESLEDSAEDQKANEYGREQGKNNPDIDSDVLVDIYRPNGLPEKY